MGYVRKRLHTLEFEDQEQFEGLEIRTSSGTTDEVFTVQELLFRERDTFEEMKADFKAIAEILVPRIDSWNLEDESEDGTRTPVPVSIEEFSKLDHEFVVKTTRAWLRSSLGVSRPLVKPSSDGETPSSQSDEDEALMSSIPMSPNPQ